MSTCSECRWWESSELEPTEERGTGECRRFPPVPLREDLEVEGYWPTTEPDDYCGEYAAKEKET